MKHLFFAFCLCLLSLSPAMAQKAQMGIAAVVNEDIITSSEVDGRYALAVHGAHMQPDEETRKQIRKQALDSLIDEQIRLQEAKKQDVMPEDKEVDEAFGKLAEQNGLTADQFKKVVQQTPNQYESLRRQLTTQIAWGNVVRKKIRPQVNITENDINNALAEQEKNPAKVEYEVAEIFMKNTDDNMKLAQQLVSELRSGKQRFSVAAHQFSQGLEASKGGLLGWIPENRLEPVLNDAIKNTPPGQISDPIVSPRGLHIFLVRQKRDVLPAKESSQRLSIKQLVVPLPPEVPQDIEAKAHAQAKFFQSQVHDCASADEAIKKIHHPLSKDLGQVRLADLPASAMNVVKDIPIGQPTDPIRAKDGYVVFVVCGREDTPEESIRDDVANTLGTDRLNRLQFRYYRDLRSAAYVDIKQN